MRIMEVVERIGHMYRHIRAGDCRHVCLWCEEYEHCQKDGVSAGSRPLRRRKNTGKSRRRRRRKYAIAKHEKK